MAKKLSAGASKKGPGNKAKPRKEPTLIDFKKKIEERQQQHFTKKRIK
jgi:hypothetical protein